MKVPSYLTGPCRLRWDGTGEMVCVIFDNGYRMVPSADETDFGGPVVGWLIVRERDHAWKKLGDARWAVPDTSKAKRGAK